LNLEPILCKHIIDLQGHGILRNVYSLKKTNCYVTGLPFVIPKMHDHHKHPKIKWYNARMAWFKGR
jgi:hypothetical protein